MTATLILCLQVNKTVQCDNVVNGKEWQMALILWQCGVNGFQLKTNKRWRLIVTTHNDDLPSAQSHTYPFYKNIQSVPIKTHLKEMCDFCNLTSATNIMALKRVNNYSGIKQSKKHTIFSQRPFL